MVRWLEGIFAIGAVTAGLLSYSVIWQAPNIRADIAKEISRIDKENVRRDMKLSDIDKSVCDLTGRITYLEDKRK